MESIEHRPKAGTNQSPDKKLHVTAVRPDSKTSALMLVGAEMQSSEAISGVAERRVGDPFDHSNSPAGIGFFAKPVNFDENPLSLYTANLSTDLD